MSRAWAALAAAAAPAAVAWAAASIAPFSTAAAGSALPPPWRELRIARVAPAEISLVTDTGVTVLQVRTRGGAGAAAHALRASTPETPVLSWRWKVDRVVESADLEAKAGDDFAARVYVFFDVPEDQVPWLARWKIRLARAFYGVELPTAALCYVWDNRHPVGTAAWSAYTDRVRMIVLESGPARAGRWIDARRDVGADFRTAFADQWTGPAPPVTGIAAGNDTDQTGEAATAWFGDFRLGPRS